MLQPRLHPADTLLASPLPTRLNQSLWDASSPLCSPFWPPHFLCVTQPCLPPYFEDLFPMLTYKVFQATLPSSTKKPVILLLLDLKPRIWVLNFKVRVPYQAWIKSVFSCLILTVPDSYNPTGSLLPLVICPFLLSRFFWLPFIKDKSLALSYPTTSFRPNKHFFLILFSV